MSRATELPPLITVDSHVHILPLKLAQRIRGFFEATGIFTSTPIPTCCNPDPSVIQKKHLMYPVNPKDLVKVILDEAKSTSTTSNISAGKLWVLPYPSRGGLSHQLNSEILELCKNLSSPNITLVPGMTVHPEDGSSIGSGDLKPEDVCSQAVVAGGRVCKLHCSVGNYSVLDEKMKRFWELAEALKLPVVIHAGISTQGTTAHEDLDDIDALCSKFPKAVIILAHTGHPNSSRAFELTLLHHNLYLDTTPVISLLPDFSPTFPSESPFSNGQSIHQHIISLAIRGRILFGSDTPTTAILRSDAAQGIRDIIRFSVSRAMGAINMEDVGGEMERVSEKCERLILGEAAEMLQEDLKSMEEALETLGPGWVRTSKL